MRVTIRTPLDALAPDPCREDAGRELGHLEPSPLPHVVESGEECRCWLEPFPVRPAAAVTEDRP